MLKGEVIIDETLCQGCGYCVHFCPRGCIEFTGGNFTPQGYLLPTVVRPDVCKPCGICAMLCPAAAIEVYKYDTEVVL